MKKKLILSAVAASALLFIVVHLSSVIYWDGGRDIELIIDQSNLAGQVVRVSYWSSPYRHLKDYSTMDPGIEKIFPASSLRDVDKDTEGRYYLIARASGKRSLLWTYYENWCDGFVVRIELSDGRVFTSIQQIKPKADLQLKVKITEPNQALQTMTFAVTPAASHPSRQRRSCLI
jgi:hypothetical protein